MSTNKATKLLKDYSKNNYNAYKTLVENGYSEETAKKQSKVILERARKAVDNKLELNNKDIKEASDDVFTLLGYDSKDIINELKKVVEQDRDFTNKLKAMKPLLDALNYRLDDDNNQKAPSVNITVEEVKTSNDVIDIETDS